MTKPILIVEDERDIRQLTSDVLAMAGYAVQTAEDGEIGWEAVRDGHYDLVITDNNMPKVSGVELVGKMRAGGINTPVIMATGTIPTAELSRSPWLRVSTILQKPFTVERLLQSVRGVLRTAESNTRYSSAETSPLACHVPI